MQLVKEFWLPIVLSFFWTAYGVIKKPLGDWLTINSVNNFIVTFFSLSFFSAQWNRVKKQVEVKQGLTGIEEKVQDMLDSLDAKTANLVSHVTGGDSYCFLHVTSEGYATFSAFGAYPLYDLGAMVLDEQKLKQKQFLGVDRLAEASEWINLGTQRPSAFFAWPHRFHLGDEEVYHYTVQFHSRNGIFSQHIQFRKFSGSWKVATKVIRYDAKLTILHEYIEAGFPREGNDQIDWNYKKGL